MPDDVNLTCISCQKYIAGPVVEVCTRDKKSQRLTKVHLHFTCFEKEFDKYKKSFFKLPDGMKLDRQEEQDIPQDQLDDYYLRREKEQYKELNGEEMPDAPKTAEQQDNTQSRESKAEEYKKLSLVYFNRAQEEKDGALFIKIVNDPASYFTVRQILSLKGVDMTVEQFEELTAIFVMLTKKATFESLQAARKLDTPKV